MGCCKSKTTDAVAGNHGAIGLQGVLPAPAPAPPFVPGPVTNFNITLVKHTGQSPSISMSWCRPRNCTSDGNIKRYHINVFTAASVHLSSTNEDGTHKLRPFTVPGNVKKFSVTHKDGLFPLNLYIVELKAESQDSIIGEEVRDSVFIHWQCRLPTCKRNRAVMNPECTALHQRKIYEFCSLKHKAESDLIYCLYPECTNMKSKLPSDSVHSTNPAKFPTTALSHFCSKDHRSMAKTSSFGFFLEVEPSSEEFRNVNEKFINSWSLKKGKCPKIEKIFAIVNPALEDAFYEYKKTLNVPRIRLYPKSKQLYHGTNFDCTMLHRYQTPCTSGECGICSISTTGFQRDKIRDRWQRFGPGFYFAPNSSKSHDYSSKPDNGKYMAMFVCQVATGKEYTLRKNKSDLKELPEGRHSVRGRSKSLIRSSDLNYDETAVYNPDAVCPRYVLLYTTEY